MKCPLYAELFERCAEERDRGAVVALLAARPEAEDPNIQAVPLRLMAGVHRLALAGAAPDLAAHYPSCGGDGDLEAAWEAFVQTIERNDALIARELDLPVQTNEPARGAAILGGFLLMAARFGLPLRVLELGASAGLTLRWDRYRYECAPWSFGPPESPVRYDDCFTHPLPFASDQSVEVVERRGCDLTPIDAGSDEGRLRLLSYVQPDQLDRVRRLEAACALARVHPAAVDRENAETWVAQRLEQAVPGVATVVFHTIFLQYPSQPEREAIVSAIAEAGARATAQAPLAHLMLEPLALPPAPNVVMTVWPGGETLELARSSLHGRDIDWRYPIVNGR